MVKYPIPEFLLHKVWAFNQNYTPEALVKIKKQGLIPRVPSEWSECLPVELRYTPTVWLAERMVSPEGKILKIRTVMLDRSRLFKLNWTEVDWWLYQGDNSTRGDNILGKCKSPRSLKISSPKWAILQSQERGEQMDKRQRNTFLTPLVVEVMPSGKRFRLHFQFTYLWKRRYFEVQVPAGFVTDFASIPRFARVLIPKLGRYNKAAVIHDYLYLHHGFRLGQGVIFRFDRLMADQCFRDGMRDLGVAEWKRTLMFWAVRLGGWLAWRNRK